MKTLRFTLVAITLLICTMAANAQEQKGQQFAKLAKLENVEYTYISKTALKLGLNTLNITGLNINDINCIEIATTKHYNTRLWFESEINKIFNNIKKEPLISNQSKEESTNVWAEEIDNKYVRNIYVLTKNKTEMTFLAIMGTVSIKAIPQLIDQDSKQAK